MTNNKVIASALVGIVVGAIGMGIIDANRPKPLFSSAYIESDDKSCAQLFQESIDILKSSPEGEIIHAEAIKELEKQKASCADGAMMLTE